MDSLLNLPEVQSAAAPLLVALLIAGLCAWRLPALTGIAVALGFLTTALLVNGTAFTPMTATRKVIVLAALAGALGAAVDWARWRPAWRPALAGLLGAGSALWVTANYLQRLEGSELWLAAAGAMGFTGAVAAAVDWLSRDALRGGTGALTLALGTGIAAMLGASALLGQMALGLAAACGGLLLLLVALPRLEFGASASFTAGLVAGQVGLAAGLFARVPWYALAILLLVPMVAGAVRPLPSPALLRALVIGLVAVLPAALAVYLTWSLQPEPLY